MRICESPEIRLSLQGENLTLERFALGEWSNQQLAFPPGHLEEFFQHLLIFESKSCVLRESDNIAKWSRLTERCVEQIYYKNWKILGSILDEFFRECCRGEICQIYAMTRLYGAYGGRCDNDHFLLIAPPHTHQDILRVVSG